MEQMEYLKFTRTFLNGLNFTQSGQLNLDNVLQGNVKNYLLGNRSFAFNETEMQEIKLDIEETYKDLLQIALVEYTEAQKLSGTKTRLHTRDLTQNYGNEKVETTFFEPVENNTQTETKQNGQNTSWQADTTQETIDEEEYNDNPTLKQFYNDIKFKVEEFFYRYINSFLWG